MIRDVVVIVIIIVVIVVVIVVVTVGDSSDSNSRAEWRAKTGFAWKYGRLKVL